MPNKHITRYKKFSKAAKSVSKRYKFNFPCMTIFMAYKITSNEYFVFQELKSFPVANILYCNANHSISFQCDFSFHENNYDNWVKSIKEKNKQGSRFVEWDEVSPTYGHRDFRNFTPEAWGRFSKKWAISGPGNADRAEMAIRVEDIKTINFYDWGFEVISDLLCLLVIDERKKCISHIFKEPTGKTSQLDVYFVGGRFKLYDISEYLNGFWTLEENHDGLENDKIINSLAIGNKIEKRPNVGQVKKTFLDLDE
ncbi:MAG: hypothetical protein J7L15_07470 [Clostridiales bacterium]|nr:hypothetical protein [Clostridiales bacterium]